MIGCLHKIISKVLARRLKSSMGGFISETQSHFIEHMNITDCLITATTAFNWLKKKKKSGALFKIDFKKAYDLVR